MMSPKERYSRRDDALDAESDRESSAVNKSGRDSMQRTNPSRSHDRRKRGFDRSDRRRDYSDSDEDRHFHRSRLNDDDDRERRRRRDRSESDSSDAAGPSRSSKGGRSRKEQSPRRDGYTSHRRHARSRSPPRKKRRSPSDSRSPPPRKSRGPLPSQNDSFAGQLPPGEKPVEKQKPNFKPTGLLAREANTVAGTSTVLKYHEPPEARKPSAKEQWRLYVFKKKDLLDTVYLHQRSVWLMGRDQKVTDLLLEHPSISKQHAVIQFRHITSTNEYGDRSSKVKPYLIDLESANGTKLNGKKVEASRFIELVDQDVVSFGDSEREYVMMLPSAEKQR